ncbi:hypothetical protein IJ670_03675, partial [bacterium]|nr:hypothetical protein [bacterium]
MNYVNKLLSALGYDTKLSLDDWTIKHQFVFDTRKWIANIVPYELLTRTLKQAVESLVTLSADGVFYENFPDNIQTPNYGDTWGVSANYIEINNRSIAYMENSSCKNGLISAMKMLC